VGSTVVFTVPLDPDDDVDVSTRGTRGESAREFSQQLRTALVSRAWRGGLIAVLAASALGAVLAAVFAPRWTDFAPLLAAVAALTVSAAVVGAGVGVAAPRDLARRSDRLSIALARTAAIIVAAVAMTAGAVPALAWLARADAMREAQAVPVLVTMGGAAAVAALLGVAVGAWREWAKPLAAGGVAGLALVALPLLGFAAAMPLTATNDQVEALQFVAINVVEANETRPAYICATNTTTERRAHPERIAWLLSASPVVSVIDAPLYTPKDLAGATAGSAASAQAALRTARLAPSDVTGFCYQPTSLGVPNAVREARVSDPGVGAATGLALEFAAFGALALVALSRRLRS